MDRTRSACRVGLLLGSAVMLVAATAAAAPARPSLRIINGAEMASGGTAIVEVRQRMRNAVAICSGAVLTPRVVLTAAHCVGRPSQMNVISGGKRIAVQRIAANPKFSIDPSTGLVHNDAALLFVKQPLKTPRIALLTSRAPAVNDSITIAGYGLNELGQAGVLRQGVTTIEQVIGEYLVSLFASNDMSNACNGDSGGPAILSYQDASGVVHTGVVGITSGGTSPTCSFGDQTIYINIQTPVVLDFITGRVPRAQQQ